MELGWGETGFGLGIAIGLLIWGHAVEKRPIDLDHPKMVSPILVKGMAIVVILLMLAHMITLGSGTAFNGNGF